MLGAARDPRVEARQLNPRLKHIRTSQLRKAASKEPYRRGVWCLGGKVCRKHAIQRHTYAPLPCVQQTEGYEESGIRHRV